MENGQGMGAAGDNVSGAGMPGVGGMPEAGSMPNMSSMPEPPKENMMASGVSEKKKSGKGMLIGLILCLILAAGGIGFGVWAMMDGNARVDDLTEQIGSLKTQNGELLDKISETTTDEGDTIINIDTDTSDVSTSDVNDATDYIYVGEWGIKIKKPENWRNLIREYTFTNGAPQGLDEFEIRENSNPGGGVTIMQHENCIDSLDPKHAVCIEIDGMTYVVGELIGELAPGADRGITDEFWSYVINPENYSKI